MLIISYILIKMIFHWLNKPYTKEYITQVSIVVPVYKEDREILYQCLKRCDEQELVKEILISIDGDDKESYKTAKKFQRNASKEVKIFFSRKRLGKRGAQEVAFQNVSTPIIVTVDSDTLLYPNAIKEIIKPFSVPQIGAVTGLLEVWNKSDNILTRILNIRYIVAGALERAFYSYFKVVNCTSGPFSAYRTELVLANLDRYVRQIHRGKKCTFGDDRHLTNLILKQGYGVFFQKTARAKTIVPNTLKKFLKQQLRWSRSFWRETYLALQWSFRRSKVLTCGMIFDALLPFLYLTNLIVGLMLFGVITNGLSFIGSYVASTALMAYFRNSEYLNFWRTKDYLLAPIYAWIYLLLILPLAIYALFTTNKMGWMTR